MKCEDCLVEKDIVLKEFSEADSEAYRILRNREDNCHFFLTGSLITKDMQKKWYDAYLNNKTEYMFSIYERSSNIFLGAVSLYHIDSSEHKAEIGRIIVDKKLAAGKGYGAQAIHGMIQWGYESLGIREFRAEILKGNYASYRSFEKNGFILTQERKENEKTLWFMERIIS